MISTSNSLVSGLIVEAVQPVTVSRTIICVKINPVKSFRQVGKHPKCFVEGSKTVLCEMIIAVMMWHSQ